MIPHRPHIEQRILDALDASPRRIPWLIGPTGSGRTSALLHLRERLGGDTCQYVNIERCATTPERFHAALDASSPFTHASSEPATVRSARQAFDATLAFFERPWRESGATFLLDEVLEFRTFESFPGLRKTMDELVPVLTRSRNRFVVSTRFESRARRVLAGASRAFEVIELPALSEAEVREALPEAAEHRVDEEIQELSRAVSSLTLGRPLYVRTLADGLATVPGVASDPVGALAALLMPGAPLSNVCRMIYELRLHRARGYGALKAILDVLAEEQPLTLTAIAQRLHRTPGSTKDYLTWLEDVDLVAVRDKRYSFADPLLRLWVGLHCGPEPPSLAHVAHEVQRFALEHLPRGEGGRAVATRLAPDARPTPAARDTASGHDESVPAGDRKSWGIVEID